MPTSDEKEQDKLIQLIRQAMERDEALREKYEIGDKFRFIREQLKDMLAQLESELKVLQPEEKKAKGQLAEGEVPVYVYLYNAQGLVLRSWVNMLTPKVFYEYSVNRPIYTNRIHIEELLRLKSNKAQHAYLTIAVKPSEILQPAEGSIQKDSNDNPVVKVKEGSLHFSKLIAFTHNGQDYLLNDDNEFVKKE